jgi:hypothetical protein
MGWALDQLHCRIRFIVSGEWLQRHIEWPNRCVPTVLSAHGRAGAAALCQGEESPAVFRSQTDNLEGRRATNKVKTILVMFPHPLTPQPWSCDDCQRIECIEFVPLAVELRVVVKSAAEGTPKSVQKVHIDFICIAEMQRRAREP